MDSTERDGWLDLWRNDEVRWAVGLSARPRADVVEVFREIALDEQHEAVKLLRVAESAREAERYGPGVDKTHSMFSLLSEARPK